MEEVGGSYWSMLEEEEDHQQCLSALLSATPYAFEAQVCEGTASAGASPVDLCDRAHPREGDAQPNATADLGGCMRDDGEERGELENGLSADPTPENEAARSTAAAATLELVLNSDQFMQELHAKETALIRFLSSPVVIGELVRLLTVLPGEDASFAQKYSSPYYAAEVFCSHSSPIILALLTDPNCATARDAFWNFLANPAPLNPVLAGYFSRCWQAIVKAHPDETVAYLASLGDAPQALARHLYSRSIADLYKCVLYVEQCIPALIEPSTIIPTLFRLLKHSADTRPFPRRATASAPRALGDGNACSLTPSEAAESGSSCASTEESSAEAPSVSPASCASEAAQTREEDEDVMCGLEGQVCVTLVARELIYQRLFISYFPVLLRDLTSQQVLLQLVDMVTSECPSCVSSGVSILTDLLCCTCVGENQISEASGPGTASDPPTLGAPMDGPETATDEDGDAEPPAASEGNTETPNSDGEGGEEEGREGDLGNTAGDDEGDSRTEDERQKVERRKNDGATGAGQEDATEHGTRGGALTSDEKAETADPPEQRLFSRPGEEEFVLAAGDSGTFENGADASLAAPQRDRASSGVSTDNDAGAKAGDAAGRGANERSETEAREGNPQEGRGTGPSSDPFVSSSAAVSSGQRDGLASETGETGETGDRGETDEAFSPFQGSGASSSCGGPAEARGGEDEEPHRNVLALSGGAQESEEEGLDIRGFNGVFEIEEDETLASSVFAKEDRKWIQQLEAGEFVELYIHPNLDRLMAKLTACCGFEDVARAAQESARGDTDKAAPEKQNPLAEKANPNGRAAARTEGTPEPANRGEPEAKPRTEEPQDTPSSPFSSPPSSASSPPSPAFSSPPFSSPAFSSPASSASLEVPGASRAPLPLCSCSPTSAHGASFAFSGPFSRWRLKGCGASLASSRLANGEFPAVGMETLELLTLVKSLLKSNAVRTASALLQRGVLDLAVELLFLHPWNTLLHLTVTDMLQSVLQRSELDSGPQIVFQHTRLIPLLIAHFQAKRRSRQALAATLDGARALGRRRGSEETNGGGQETGEREADDRNRGSRQKREKRETCGYTAHLLQIAQLVGATLEAKPELLDLLPVVWQRQWDDVVSELLYYQQMILSEDAVSLDLEDGTLATLPAVRTLGDSFPSSGDSFGGSGVYTAKPAFESDTSGAAYNGNLQDVYASSDLFGAGASHGEGAFGDAPLSDAGNHATRGARTSDGYGGTFCQNPQSHGGAHAFRPVRQDSIELALLREQAPTESVRGERGEERRQDEARSADNARGVDNLSRRGPDKDVDQETNGEDGKEKEDSLKKRGEDEQV